MIKTLINNVWVEQLPDTDGQLYRVYHSATGHREQLYKFVAEFPDNY